MSYFMIERDADAGRRIPFRMDSMAFTRLFTGRARTLFYDALKNWLSVGILLATVLYAVGFGISLWAGAVEIAGVAFNPSSLLISLVFFLLVAVTEELALRDLYWNALQSGVNKFCALFLSAALFSLIHIGNPNFDFLSFINILLVGILLGSSYIHT